MSEITKKDGAVKAKTATKKTVKPKLSFTPGTEIVKEVVKDDVIKDDVINETVSAEKEIDQPINDEVSLNNTETVIDNLPVEEVEIPQPVKSIPAKPVHQATKPAYVNKNYNGSKAVNANSGPKPSSKEMPPAAGLYPDHMVQIALIIKNNAEIRRFTALGILNWLLQKGEIKGEKKYVSFKWNKFTVKIDNLTKDYSYTETFFLNCLVSSFASFSASAQRTIDNFTHKELNKSLGETASQEEVDKIFQSIENR